MTESFEAMKTTGLNTIGITNDDKNTESEQWAAKNEIRRIISI